jgi:hypothetical protein
MNAKRRRLFGNRCSGSTAGIPLASKRQMT